MICSYVFWPIAVVMGADVSDCRNVAELVGTKTFLNEFVAYSELAVFISNRKLLDAHVSNNGSWHWLNDDIIMTSSGANDTVLSRGVMSVSDTELFSCEGYRCLFTKNSLYILYSADRLSAIVTARK
jgi:Na+ dependent nucleoside transporter C-terminus